MVSLKGKQAAMETLNGKRNIKIELPRDSIPFYQKEILKLSETGFFLPMRFIFQEGICQIFYDCSERIPLEEYLKAKKGVGIHSFIEDGLLLLEHLLEQVQQGENYMLFLEDYQLSFEILYVYERKQRIELLFLPKDNVTDFSEDFKLLLTKIEQIIDDKQWSVYSQELIKSQMEKNLGVQELLFYLRDMKGQICYSDRL